MQLVDTHEQSSKRILRESGIETLTVDTQHFEGRWYGDVTVTFLGNPECVKVSNFRLDPLRNALTHPESLQKLCDVVNEFKRKLNELT